VLRYYLLGVGGSAHLGKKMGTPYTPGKNVEKWVFPEPKKRGWLEKNPKRGEGSVKKQKAGACSRWSQISQKERPNWKGSSCSKNEWGGD